MPLGIGATRNAAPIPMPRRLILPRMVAVFVSPHPAHDLASEQDVVVVSRIKVWRAIILWPLQRQAGFRARPDLHQGAQQCRRDVRGQRDQAVFLWHTPIPPLFGRGVQPLDFAALHLYGLARNPETGNYEMFSVDPIEGLVIECVTAATNDAIGQGVTRNPPQLGSHIGAEGRLVTLLKRFLVTLILIAAMTGCWAVVIAFASSDRLFGLALVLGVGTLWATLKAIAVIYREWTKH